MPRILTQVESAVANTILDAFQKRNALITHMKLQKLFYFSFGRYLAKYDESIIEHYFEAWPYGPVLPELYSSLKNYSDSPITKLISHSDNIPYLYESGNILNIVTKTVDKFFYYTAWQLSEITHAKDGPWFITVKNNNYREKIDNDLIKNYFRNHPIISQGL